MSFLQHQGLFLTSGLMKLSPKVTQLIGDSVTLEPGLLTLELFFFPLYYYIKGLPVFSSWTELPGEAMFSLRIITSQVLSPNCLHSLANLKLTQAWLWFKENMFLKAFRVL